MSVVVIALWMVNWLCGLSLPFKKRKKERKNCHCVTLPFYFTFRKKYIIKKFIFRKNIVDSRGKVRGNMIELWNFISFKCLMPYLVFLLCCAYCFLFLINKIPLFDRKVKLNCTGNFIIQLWRNYSFKFRRYNKDMVVYRLKQSFNHTKISFYNLYDRWYF